MKWTPEQDERVMALAREGKAPSFIADDLGVTLGALYGRIERLRRTGHVVPRTQPGISATVTPKKIKAGTVAKHDAKRIKPAVTLVAIKIYPGERRERTSRAIGECPEAPPVDTTSIAAVDGAVESQETAATYPHVPILDRKLGQCAFPLWTNDRLPVADKFCCAAPIERGAYCAEHAGRCYGGWRDDERVPFVSRRDAA